MRLSDHRSRASVMPAHERVDPYWSGMWNPGGTANWLSRPTVERLAEQGLVRPPRWLSKTSDDAMRDIATGVRSTSQLRAIAAIGCFRTLTTEQLAAITGEPLFATNNEAVVYTNLLASGLVNEGIIKMPGHHRMPRMVRPFAGNSAGVKPLVSHLNDTDAVGVTHGQPWRAGSMNDRHNMLAAELLLRIAEYTNASLVLGEQLASIEQLTDLNSKRAGDGMFVLPNGGVVVIEMTATINSGFPAKMEAWAAALGQNPNLSVVFVDITHPDHSEKSAYVGKVLRREIKAASSDMSYILADVAKRMMVARWIDWFPAAGEVSADFFSLKAQRPVGNGITEDLWQDIHITDPFSFNLPPSGLGLLANSNLLYGVPHWQQTGSASVRGLAKTRQEPRQ